MCLWSKGLAMAHEYRRKTNLREENLRKVSLRKNLRRTRGCGWRGALETGRG